MGNKLKQPILILVSASIFTALLYLIASKLLFNVGFPLDDAWIHQTFARNFAQTGEWSFMRGHIAGGSTSPLWTFFLSIGYLVNAPYYVWVFAAGGLMLFLLGMVGQNLFQLISHRENNSFRLPIFGLLLITEWRMIWAAFSGMETLLLSLLILFSAYLLKKDHVNWLLAGLIAGLMIWVRPDGILIICPVILVALFTEDKKSISSRLAKIFLGFLILTIPYLIFNLKVSGEIWPTTYFAKQAEYAVLRKQPILNRAFSLYSQLFVGVGIVLLPGFIYSIYKIFAKKNWWSISFLLWVVGYVFVYVIRLPVTYQHARYIMPALPLFYLFSFLGFNDISSVFSQQKKGYQIIQKFWNLTLIAVVFLFLFLGAKSYSMDVAIIESEMVNAAKWIAENTPESSVIASHDIGALGFWGNREIIDLAGLIEPEVIPFINDEERLGDYIKMKKADYLFAFPMWYPNLTQSHKIVYSTNSRFSPESGGENIHIYKLDF